MSNSQAGALAAHLGVSRSLIAWALGLPVGSALAMEYRKYKFCFTQG